jgi:hypothetical protein
MTDPRTSQRCHYFAIVEDDHRQGTRRQRQQARTSPLRFVQIQCHVERGHDSAWILERDLAPIPWSKIPEVLSEAPANYAAERIIDAAFNASDSSCIVRDPGGFGALAEADSREVEALHRLLLGDPTQAVLSALRSPQTNAASGITAQIPLPIDSPLDFIKVGLQVAGMAVGTIAGCPILTTACCKSFLHDQLVRGAAHGIRGLAPRPGHPPPPPPAAIGSHPWIGNGQRLRTVPAPLCPRILIIRT